MVVFNSALKQDFGVEDLGLKKLGIKTDNFKNDNINYCSMSVETVCILKKEYVDLKKKASLADDLIVQLDASLSDLRTGKIKKVY